MANSYDLITKYQSQVQDEIYKAGSLTAMLDSDSKSIENAGANLVKIMKVDTVGAGDFSKVTGHPVGDSDIGWEDIQLTISRGRKLFIDRMDDEELGGNALPKLVGNYTGKRVIPETDAVRFARYCDGAGNTATADLTASTIVAALDTGQEALDDGEVPFEGRFCFIESKKWRELNQALTRSWGNEQRPDRRVFELDGTLYVPVPQGRFFTEVTLSAGATSSAGGFSKTATTGRFLNFILLDPAAVWQSSKLDLIKLFGPDSDDEGDNWRALFRQYHDAGVLENKTDGVYAHHKTT